MEDRGNPPISSTNPGHAVPYLTVRGIEALKARKKGYKVTVDRDLYLRASTDGTQTWLVRYVVDNRSG